MSDFTKAIHNPMEMIKEWWPDADISHIEYDPTMKRKDRQYWRIEQCGGDGTLLFSIDMMQKLLLRILNKDSWHIPSLPEDQSTVKDIKYTIGNISHATVFGKVELKCGGKYPGQCERVRMPVKCEYIYKDGE